MLVTAFNLTNFIANPGVNAYFLNPLFVRINLVANGLETSLK
jgi:hypothetical protein